MAQQGFPGRHTTTTSVTQTTVSPEIRFDPTYIRTIPGILKCACLVSKVINILLYNIERKARCYYKTFSRKSEIFDNNYF